MLQHTTIHRGPQIRAPYFFVQTSDGIALRIGHWRALGQKCRGTIVVLHGRAEFIEKYHETIRELRQRGLDVFSFDWRGQGLSGRLLTRHTKGYVGDYSHYVADLSQVMQTIVTPGARADLVFLGHSMGGHISVRYLQTQPATPIAKLILCAPMLGIQTGVIPERWVRHVSRWMIRLGLGHIDLPVPSIAPYRDSFNGNCLTSDPERYDRILCLLRENPGLRVDSVTLGWLAATFTSLYLLNQNLSSPSIDIPMLIFKAGDDRIVHNDAIQHFAQLSPNRRLVVIDHAKHEILQERDGVRAQFWKAFDEFMAN